MDPILSQYKCRKKPFVYRHEVELAKSFLPWGLWAMLTCKPMGLNVVQTGPLPWEMTHNFGPCEQARPVVLQVPESCLGLCTPASRVSR